MSLLTASCSACVAAVILCAVLELSQSRDCSTEKTENATVDLQVALSQGIRGADPVHVASWEACINICCFGKSISANKKCNLVVFKPQKKGNSPNCYLFYCPSEQACPVKQAAGLVTYRTIRDAEVLKPTSSSNKSLDLIVNGSFVSPKAVVLDVSSPTTPPNWLDPSQKSVTPKTSKVLFSQIDKPVDKIHEHSNHPKGEGANPSESSDSRLTDQTISSLTPATSPQNLVPIVQSTVKLPAVTRSTQASTVAVVPRSTAPSAGRTTADYGKSYMASARQSHPASQPTATSQARAGNPTPLPSSLSKKVSSAASHEAHLRDGQLSGESDAPDGAPGEAPYLGDKNVLLAALFFGVIFLLVAQVVIGQKMIESLRQKRYSRLDYLINGMYANV
ncbi:MANSC domain-containing protein 1 [Eublepharis macularius]|uniref:MANSC domain-containing protein 1 n=1 Tax=Eublepharis macularius TaxID=481883 RepID=A0AA97KKI3_EUBMA|nr:MANSC domain-containing protein 1 [Eublepharis macularius]